MECRIADQFSDAVDRVTMPELKLFEASFAVLIKLVALDAQRGALPISTLRQGINSFEERACIVEGRIDPTCVWPNTATSSSKQLVSSFFAATWTIISCWRFGHAMIPQPILNLWLGPVNKTSHDILAD